MRNLCTDIIPFCQPFFHHSRPGSDDRHVKILHIKDDLISVDALNIAGEAYIPFFFIGPFLRLFYRINHRAGISVAA